MSPGIVRSLGMVSSSMDSVGMSSMVVSSMVIVQTILKGWHGTVWHDCSVSVGPYLSFSMFSTECETERIT